MKRSQMIEIISGILMDFRKINTDKDKYWAEIIIDIVEKHGMLPPVYLENRKVYNLWSSLISICKVPKYQWEPEDEEE